MKKFIIRQPNQDILVLTTSDFKVIAYIMNGQKIECDFRSAVAIHLRNLITCQNIISI